jgi:hypothetical protein
MNIPSPLLRKAGWLGRWWEVGVVTVRDPVCPKHNDEMVMRLYLLTVLVVNTAGTTAQSDLVPILNIIYITSYNLTCRAINICTIDCHVCQQSMKTSG